MLVTQSKICVVKIIIIIIIYSAVLLVCMCVNECACALSVLTTYFIISRCPPHGCFVSLFLRLRTVPDFVERDFSFFRCISISIDDDAQEMYDERSVCDPSAD